MNPRILAVSALLVLTGCTSDQRAAEPPVPVSQPVVVEPGPLQVLHDWDASRSAAWEHADPVALSGLYPPGSRTGARDVALLKRYLARGVRLRGMRMQVLSARVVVKRAARVRLVVVERFAGAQAETGGGVRDLPAGRPVRRVIELRRSDGRWLVDAVSSLPREVPR